MSPIRTLKASSPSWRAGDKRPMEAFKERLFAGTTDGSKFLPPAGNAFFQAVAADLSGAGSWLMSRAAVTCASGTNSILVEQITVSEKTARLGIRIHVEARISFASRESRSRCHPCSSTTSLRRIDLRPLLEKTRSPLGERNLLPSVCPSEKAFFKGLHGPLIAGAPKTVMTP